MFLQDTLFWLLQSRTGNILTKLVLSPGTLHIPPLLDLAHPRGLWRIVDFQESFLPQSEQRILSDLHVSLPSALGVQEAGGAIPLLSRLCHASVLTPELRYLTSPSGFIIQPFYPRTAGSLPFPGLQEQSRSRCDHCRDILCPHPNHSHNSVLLGRKDQ